MSLDGTGGLGTITGGSFPAAIWTEFAAGALANEPVVSFAVPGGTGVETIAPTYSYDQPSDTPYPSYSPKPSNTATKPDKPTPTPQPTHTTTLPTPTQSPTGPAGPGQPNAQPAIPAQQDFRQWRRSHVT